MKKTIKIFMALIIEIIIGTILLAISYLLPAEKIEENVNKSIGVFKKEETHEAEIYGYKMTELDNYTDAIMLQNASYTGNENIIDKSMNVYRYLNDEHPCNSLIMQMEHNNKNKVAYDRYWHGYLVFSKPMLILFSYNDIRLINSIIQPLLIIC